MRQIFLCALLWVLGGGAALACGPESDCRVGARTYRVALPEEDRPVGAIVYAHGYRGSAEAVMRNGSLRRLAAEEGLALIALESREDDWVIPHAPRHAGTDGAEEFAYVEAVLADAARRFAIDRARVIGAGFFLGRDADVDAGLRDARAVRRHHRRGGHRSGSARPRGAPRR